MSVRLGYVDTSVGQLHVAECGTGDPVLFLHQTPRSWREFEAVLPLAGRDVRALAMDTRGFGRSARVDGPWSIEVFADGVLALLDALDLPQVSLVGHHTGGVVAVEVAARAPERVAALVLSGVPYVDEERRRAVRDRAPIDHVVPVRDGRHLTALWGRRRHFYAAGEEHLLARYVADALEVLDRVEEGHVRVNEYRMEDRLPLVSARALVVCGADDGHSLPDVPAITAVLGCGARVIDGAGVPLPEQRPAEFARVVVDFVTGGPR